MADPRPPADLSHLPLSERLGRIVAGLDQVTGLQHVDARTRDLTERVALHVREAQAAAQDLELGLTVVCPSCGWMGVCTPAGHR